MHDSRLHYASMSIGPTRKSGLTTPILELKAARSSSIKSYYRSMQINSSYQCAELAA